MSDCRFCSGAVIPGDTYKADGYAPMAVNIAYITGRPASGYGVRLDRGHLLFDNSCNEYADGAIPINYCPFCGRKISRS